MHLPTTLLVTALSSTLALSDTLKPRNWDFHLLTSGCSPNSSNYDISIYHRSGVAARSCISLAEDSNPNTTAVATISWKSPIAEPYALCTFQDGECSADGFIEAVRGDWEVCYPYKGWVGWKVVGSGEDCI
ncbi:hypothetical protein N8T08_004775 [Aspergillus melleus]|uniref:Uncharacterized protein n=1 Tax=Aspergillus melleus TaxID=138277 RepID=A0ACC3B4C6_9EURO|nr:hypothetical protein N8T08_004775 [Aspergillus melleus]